MKRTMSFVLMAVLLSGSAFAAGKSDSSHGNAGQSNAGGNGHGEQVSFEHFSTPGSEHASPYSAPIRSTVPEPETYALALAGLGVVGIAAWRRRRAR